MCTVTFLPCGDLVFLTSSRDERAGRPPADPPAWYPSPTGTLLFPRDGKAGGTWIVLHENGHAAVLLNGAFSGHAPQPSYRRSRGLILLDLIGSHAPFDAFRSINLEDIEPFTVVLWAGETLFECRWDGEKKHAGMLAKDRPRIWSSATLYERDAVSRRESWFADWLRGQADFRRDDLLHFHQHTGEGDRHNDLLMNRGEVFTVSICCLELNPGSGTMVYRDLVQQTDHCRNLPFTKAFADPL